MHILQQEIRRLIFRPLSDSGPLHAAFAACELLELRIFQQLATGSEISRAQEKTVAVIGVFLHHADSGVPKLQSLNHVVSSMAEVAGRIDESFLPPGIIDLPSTLERYAGMKGDARGLLRARHFLRRKYNVPGFKANEKGVEGGQSF